MADSIQNKRNQQTYLRQTYQEKALRKRDLLKAQQEDIKSVRDYYADQSKQLDSETAAAITHINEESRQLALAEKQERNDRMQQAAEQKRVAQEEMATNRSQGIQQSSVDADDEKKNSIPARLKARI